MMRRWTLAGITALSGLIVSTVVSAAPTDLFTHRYATDKVALAAPLKAAGFSLNSVRLLPGPFQHAQELDRKYLLSLDPDRLLLTARRNAGLPDMGKKPYGGWEEPTGEVRGHFLGHYLSACAQMAQATGDPELRRRVTYLCAELGKCQDALKTGYLSAFPESFIDRVIAGTPVWAPWYTLHKIQAGLLDAYNLCGERKGLEVARRMGDWTADRMARLSDAQIQRMLENEQGGITESMASLYAATADKKYLNTSLRMIHLRIVGPLEHSIDPLDGVHANTQIPKIIGAARQYELTGKQELYTASSSFWNFVTHERSYVIGGNSDGEGFSPKAHLSKYFGPSTTETCNTYNMLKLTRSLFEWQPKAEYADYYERALFNHILASQNPDNGMMCYYVPLRSGSEKVYNTPEDSFWCCTGTGIENHARYGELIYASGSDGSLFVNQFIASQLTTPALKLRQETGFPLTPYSTITVEAALRKPFAMQIRHPFWATSGFTMLLNGKPVTETSAPGSYAVIKRGWKKGDRIEVRLPMHLRTEGFADDPNRFAFLYGPIVLGAPVSTPAPTLSAVSDKPVTALTEQLTAAPGLTFTVPAGLIRSASNPDISVSVTLKPFYQLQHGRYEVYWDRRTPVQWAEQQAAYRKEQDRLRELARQTVDVVQPNFTQQERDHGYVGQDSASGDFNGHGWRDARNGGWFSYKLRHSAHSSLYLTYWGSDVGPREFDILIDGKVVGTQKLNSNMPEKFFTVKYPLPQGTGGTFTLKLQAHPGMMAGGLFEARVIKAD